MNTQKQIGLICHQCGALQTRCLCISIAKLAKKRRVALYCPLCEQPNPFGSKGASCCRCQMIAADAKKKGIEFTDLTLDEIRKQAVIASDRLAIALKQLGGIPKTFPKLTPPFGGDEFMGWLKREIG